MKQVLNSLKIMFKNHQPVSKRNGVASLAFTLVLGGIIVNIGLIIAFLAYILNFSNFGIRLSAEALAAARSGIDDGLLRITRGTDVLDYSFAVGNASVAVSICETASATCSVTANQRQIIATGGILTKKRQLVAIAEVDPVNRLIKINSVAEIPL